MTAFEVGRNYTREAVADEIGLPEDRRKGGVWATGYSRWRGEVFIFCNVGTAGRTGHDYPNRWDGKVLEWSGKTGSNLNQPLIQEMLSGAVAVHLFWRGKDRSPFTYAGLASPVGVRDTSPVEISWTFEEPVPVDTQPIGANVAEAGLASYIAVFRRGPVPVISGLTRTAGGGPASVYVMQLQGAVSTFMPKVPPGHLVIKVGMSNAPLRRQAELNNGFPQGATVGWHLKASREYPSAIEAFEAEGAILEKLRLSGYWIGGEFACVPIGEVPNL